MLQFSPGLAPVDCLVDVLGGSSVGPGLVFDWFLIGVSLSVRWKARLICKVAEELGEERQLLDY